MTKKFNLDGELILFATEKLVYALVFLKLHFSNP